LPVFLPAVFLGVFPGVFLGREAAATSRLSYLQIFTKRVLVFPFPQNRVNDSRLNS